MSELYKKVNSNHFSNIKIIDFPRSEILKIYRILRRIGRNIIPERISYTETNSWPIKKFLSYDIHGAIIHFSEIQHLDLTSIEIFKDNDEYYYVVAINSTKQYLYICDGLDGLEELLSDILNIYSQK